MKTKAVRLYGTMDLRTEEFELPEIAEDEILASVISDSLCMSTYKAASQGTNHKRVPKDAGIRPVMVGHEFAGEIVKVGAKWADTYKVGERYVLQPALNYKGSLASPGYSYQWCGGDATYIVIPHEVMELGCLLPYHGEAFFEGSLAEPMSCIIGAFHATYHTKPGVYVHEMEPKAGGKMALLASAGPMGLGAIDYALHGLQNPPSFLVVTDIDEARLARAKSIFPPENEKNTKLLFVNTKQITYPADYLTQLTGGTGFDDVFVYAPVRSLVELGDKILARDGCLNFFAGPTDMQFSAEFNFYNVHYLSHHIVGTSGGNTDDMRESLALAEQGKIRPAAMVTHVGGLNAAAEATLNLPHIPGGKKLIYTQVSLPLTAIADFAKLADEGGEYASLYADLAQLCAEAGGLWNVNAEKRLLKEAEK